jgi:hypothetical protein
MNGYCNIKPDQRIFRIGKLHAYAGNDQKKTKYSITEMPDPDINGV